MSNYSRALPLKVFTKVKNAGDQFSLLIARTFLADDVLSIGDVPYSHPHVMLLGSILQWADAQTIAAGAGFLSADSRPIALPSSVFLLRGPLTAAVLERLGGYPVGSQPYGDPGVLASRLFPASDTGDIPFAVIPHYVDNQESALHEVSADGGVLIDPLQPLPRYFELLHRSRVVLSSTLHGLIFAHAYGKPALWLEFGDRVLGNGFKFFDYYQSIGVPPQDVPYFRIGRDQRLSKLLHLAKPHHNAHLIDNVENAILSVKELWNAQ
jgi:pyruvyltransferase